LRKRGNHTARLVLLLLMLTGAALAVQAQAPSREYQVKAVFLYHFTRFVEWPPAAFTSREAPFVIGIAGTNPFGNFLQEIVSGETVMGRPIVVHTFADARDARGCHLLFLNGSVTSEVLDNLSERSVLTVSDGEHFLKKGGMIRLFVEQNKPRMQISPAALRSARLTASSKLLRLAEIIN
jgi:hypothetical protein